MVEILDRVAIKARAKENFQGNYWPIVGALAINAAIYAACSAMSSVYVGYVAMLIGIPVLNAGVAAYCLKVYRGEAVQVVDIFDGFKQFGRTLGGMLWMELWTVLWSLLFIVPGVIKGISYSMTPYILMDQPEIDVKEALKLSVKMTDGHKGDIFVMALSFIGWELLAFVTCGVLGIFYVTPYTNITMAGYYEQLKNGGTFTEDTEENYYDGENLYE